MSLFTTEQILEIQDLVRLHHNAYIVNTMGRGALSEGEVKELVEKGLLSEDPEETIQESYVFGQLLGAKPETRNMSYSDFQNYVQKNPIPLNAIERGAVQMAQLRAAQYCKGLGNRISTDMTQVFIEADSQLRARMEDDIKTATAHNIAAREAIDKLRSDIGWATRDWARDLRRIAITEKTYAMQRGQADALRGDYGPDVLVSRIPRPDACDKCKELHIGKNGLPYVFKLSELEDNGSNVGVPRADWKPVVGAIHPHCQCPMNRVPPGWGYDEEWDLIPGGEKGKTKEEMEEENAKKSLQKGESYPPLRHRQFQGLRIAIETEEGTKRKWRDSSGNTGETLMTGASYGYVKNTNGLDGEEMDCFVGHDEQAENVFIIDQLNPHTGLYDEQKCMIGFSNERSAIDTYRANYDDADNYFYDVQAIPIDAFKRWLGIMEKSGVILDAEVPDRVPGPGLGINYYIPVPAKKKKRAKRKADHQLELKYYFAQPSIPGHSGSIRVDKEIYDFDSAIHYLNPLEIPAEQAEMHKETRKTKDTNKKNLKDKAKDNIRTKNEVL